MSDDNNQVNQFEKEARLLGWVPKEEFRDGDNWVDAETFVKRGKEINPILRKNNEILLKKLEDSKREIEEVKRVAKEFEKYQKDNAERKVKELEKELLSLKEQKKAAVAAGDGEAVVALDDQIDEVKQQQKDAKKEPEKSTAPAATQADPVVTAWMEENEWYTSDFKYSNIADSLGRQIRQENPNLFGKAFFDKLDAELEEVLPVKYRKGSSNQMVDSGSSAPARPSTKPSKQSYENLPAEAKAACDRFVKQGLMTKEQYLADYQWE